MRHFCKILCLTGVVLLFCADAAQAQRGFRKMICRGGDEAFRIDNLSEERGKIQLGVNFSPSSGAPGSNVWKLDVGTCSWADRVLADGEPQQIQLFVTPDEAQRIRNHLNTSENNFWQFYVRDTERGYYETRNHALLIVTTKQQGAKQR